MIGSVVIFGIDGNALDGLSLVGDLRKMNICLSFIPFGWSYFRQNEQQLRSID